MSVAAACALCGETRARPVLQGTDRLYRTTTREFAVVRCSQCGLLRLDPMPSGAELAAYYPQNYWFAPDESAAGNLEEAWRRLVLRDHIAFVEKALAGCPGTGPVLDVGCGGGLFPATLRKAGIPAVGLDFSAGAARVAWREKGVPVVCGDLAHAPLRAGGFRAVTMFHVLEHVPDPPAYLAAARALLAAGGRLIVQVPNASCWQFRALGWRWNGLDIPRHLTDFRAADLEHLLEKSGFRVIRRKHFSLRDNPAGLASSLAPGLDPMARRVRRNPERPAAKLWKDLVYLALLGAALPFAALEAACGAGSTVMMEARPQP